VSAHCMYMLVTALITAVGSLNLVNALVSVAGKEPRLVRSRS
jgi:hypothetical protein